MAGSPRRAKLAGWGLIGFLLGAVFWQVVGFWEFLGSFAGDRSDAPASVQRMLGDLTVAPALAHAFAPGVSAAWMAFGAEQNCTTLSRDVETGKTTATPCVAVLMGGPEASVPASHPALGEPGARVSAVR